MEMLLTIEQTAIRLQLHPETVRRQLVRGTLRGIRRGRVWRVPESALVESIPSAPIKRAEAVRVARGAMKSANHSNVVQTFLEEKQADNVRDASRELSGVCA